MYFDLDKPIMMEELKLAINTAKHSFAQTRGLNQIDYVIIKNFSPEYSLNFLIYNCILEAGIFPEDWKHALVVFIPKTGD